MHGKKNIWVLLVAVGWVAFGYLAPMAQAQNTPGTQQYAPTVKQAVAGSCGDERIHFHATILEAPADPGDPDDPIAWHPLAPSVADQATVYVIGSFVNSPIIRVGVDGKWVGAIRGSSYMYFHVAPGLHHFCADWQSSLISAYSVVDLKDIEMQAGHTYYIRVLLHFSDVSIDDWPVWDLNMKTVDPSEGMYLLAEEPPGSFKVIAAHRHPKKKQRKKP